MHTIALPLKPTFKRYVQIFYKNRDISIFRALEYEALSKITYSGHILDFGGGEKANYINWLKSQIVGGKYESVNICTHMEPSYLVEIGKPLPINNRVFDMVLSFNTLEHIYNLDFILTELTRILKPGGQIVYAVPFLYRVHGCPNDYNRPTANWWIEKLSALGFDDLSITPLVWDPITTGSSVSEGVGPLASLRRIVIPLYGVFYGLIKAPLNSQVYPPLIGAQIANFALGYVITGKKRNGPL